MAGNCFVSSKTKTGERVDVAKSRLMDLMNVSPESRSAQDVLDVLKQSRLVDPASKLTETIFVNKSSGKVSIYDQVDGIQLLNRFIRNYYKTKDDLFTVSGVSKSQRQKQGIPLNSIHYSIKGEAQGYATVKINEDVILGIPQTVPVPAEEPGVDPMVAAMERLSQTELGRQYASAISTYLEQTRNTGTDLDEAIQSEMALRENTSEQQMESFESSTRDDKTIEGQTEKLRQNFEKIGIRVKIVYDPSLPVLGEAVKITDPDFDAQVTLNPDMMQNDTAFHEFGHLYVDLLGYDHPIVQAAIAQLRGTELYAKVEEKYSKSLKGDIEKLEKEVLVTAIGLNGAKINTKNPSKFQAILNRFFRAVGKIFGIEPNLAAQLAEEMFAGNMRANEFLGRLSFEKQQSQSLDPIKRAIENARIGVEENLSIARRAKDPTSKRNARLLEFHKQRLEIVQEAEDFMDFVDFVNNLFNETESTFEEVDRRFNPNIDEQERLELIQMLGNVSMYLKSYFDRNGKKGIMKDIRDAAAEKLDLLKKSPNITQQQMNNINALYDKIVTLNDKMELVYDRYLKLGIPLKATMLLQYHKSDVNDQLEALAINVETSKVLRNPIIDAEWLEIKKDRKQGRITKDEEKTLLADLNAKQIRAKKVGYKELVRQLTDAQLDKSAYSAYIDPIIYSSQTGLQLFAMEIKDAYLTAANETRDVQFELAPEYKKFLETKSGLNAAVAYRNMYETVTHYVRELNDKGVFEYKAVEALSFVQEYDVSRYNKGLRDAVDAAGRNWGRPPYTDKVALDEWKTSKDARFVSLRKGYYQEIDAWHANNSAEAPHSRVRLANLKADKKRAEREYLRWKTTDPSRASLAYTELESISAEIDFIYNEYNDTFRGDAVMPNSSYVNPRYKELQNDPVAFDYYKTLLKIYHENGQDKLGKTNQIKNSWDEYSYIVPSVEGDTVGQMQSSGFMEASREMIRESFSLTDGDTEFGELIGDKRDIVPVFFTGRMDPKLVTRDLTGAVMQFVKMANLFEAKSQIHSSVILMRDIIKERKVLKSSVIAGVPVVGNIARRLGYVTYETESGEKSNVYKQVDDLIQSMFYGRKENAVNIPTKRGRIINVNKISNSFAGFTAKKVLALNLLQSTNQLLLDNYKLLEEGLTGQYFNVANRTWAEGKAWSSGLFGVSDWGAFAAKSKIIKAALWSDAYSDQLSGMSFNTGSKARQALTGNWGHILQSSAEHHVVLVRMLAMMDSYKGKLKDKNGNVILNADGAEANLYDVLIEKKNGSLELDPRVANMSQLEFVNKLGSLVKKTNQIKGDFDRSAIEREWWGKLVTLFRRFFPSSYRRSWGYGSNRGVHVDTESGFIGGGMYSMLWNYIMDTRTQGVKFATRYKSMEEYEKKNLKRAMINVGAMITTAILGGMVYSDDEDDKVQNFFAYQAIRMNAELMQFINPNDFIRIIKSPTATMNTFDSMLGLAEQVFRYEIPYAMGVNVDKKNIFYQRSTNGYKKGTRKIVKKFNDNIPFYVGPSKSSRPEDAITFYNQ
jgi:hypothetical protein